MADKKEITPDSSGLPGETERQLIGGRIFLTGGTSAVGAEIAGFLGRAGAGVDALLRQPDQASDLKSATRLIPGDCRRPADYKEALRACNRIIHVAGLQLASPLIRALAGHDGLERVVFIGSARIGYPDELLSAAELRNKRQLQAAEEEIISSRLPWTILRPTLIFSPRDRSLSRIRRYLEKRPVFPLPGTGRAVKQPISARDLAVSVLNALVSPAARRKCYDLPGRDISVREMIETMSREMGRGVWLLPVPRWPLNMINAGLGLLGISGGRRALIQYLRWYREMPVSGEAAAGDFNHRPRSFAENFREQLAAAAGEGTTPAGPIKD